MLAVAAIGALAEGGEALTSDSLSRDTDPIHGHVLTPTAAKSTQVSSTQPPTTQSEQTHHRESGDDDGHASASQPDHPHSYDRHTTDANHTHGVMQTYTVSLEKTTFTTVFNYSALATVVHQNISAGEHKKEGQHNETLVQVQLPGTNVTGTDSDNDGDVDSWSQNGDSDSGSSRNLKYLWLFFLLLPLALVCIVVFACMRRRRANERQLRRASLRNQALRMDLGTQSMTEAQDTWHSAFSFRHSRRNRRTPHVDQAEERDEPLPLYDGHESSTPELRHSTPPVYDEVDEVPGSGGESQFPTEGLTRQMTNPQVSREYRRMTGHHSTHDSGDLSQQSDTTPRQSREFSPKYTRNSGQRLSKGISMHSREVHEEEGDETDIERGSNDYYTEGDIGRQRL